MNQHCPQCDCCSSVVTIRTTAAGVVRWHRCTECGHEWTPESPRRDEPTTAACALPGLGVVIPRGTL